MLGTPTTHTTGQPQSARPSVLVPYLLCPPTPPPPFTFPPPPISQQTPYTHHTYHTPIITAHQPDTVWEMNHHQGTWAHSSKGDALWLSDPDEGYVEVHLVALQDGGKLVVEDNDGKRFTVDVSGHASSTTVPRRKHGGADGIVRRLLPRGGGDSSSSSSSSGSSSTKGIENMDDLHPLNEASILANVTHRFRLDKIYTRTGPILIALNPFKWLPIYGPEVVRQYHGKPYGVLPPHCYQEAEDAYQQLQHTQRNQSVVICGESGAGKTETTKLMLQFISLVARDGTAAVGPGEGSSSSVAAAPATIGERLVQSNPLMEAMGNAKTLRNNNSSRFGKFTLLHFDRPGDRKQQQQQQQQQQRGGGFPITGGRVSNFLLEKSRVVRQQSGERNFHIFYQLLAAPEELRERLRLPRKGEASSFHYLAQSGCSRVAGVDDGEDLAATRAAMDAVGIPREEQDAFFQLVVACLYLGNVDFDGSEDGESCSLRGAAAADAAPEGAPPTPVMLAGALLGLAPEALAEALTTRVRQLPGGKTVSSPQTVAQARDSRDALAKAVYSRVFDCLVDRLNAAFAGGDDPREAEATPSFIGVLDIFGFEDFLHNSFEQLLINYTNERLQLLFNEATFKREEEEYAREAIEWDRTDFPDNQPCVDLIEKKPLGLLPILDSECTRGAAASDATLVSTYHKTFKDHPHYGVCGPSTVWRKQARVGGGGSTGSLFTSEQDFVVCHYAGPVIYDGASDFVEKNRDAVFDHVTTLLATGSTNPLVTSLFQTPLSSSLTPSAAVPPPQGRGGAEDTAALRAGNATVGQRFMAQLNGLIQTLESSNVRFVRCIKSNQLLEPQVMDKPSIRTQLICSGVMAALEVRRAGFPTRVHYADFVRDFRVFAVGFPTLGKEEDAHARHARLVAEHRTATQIAAAAAAAAAGEGAAGHESDDAAELERARALTAKMMTHPSVIDAVTARQYRLGRTKLFLHADTLTVLQSLKNKIMLPKILQLQRWWIRRSESALAHKLKRVAQVVREWETKADVAGIHGAPTVRRALEDAAAAVLYARRLDSLDPKVFRPAVQRACQKAQAAETVVLRALAGKERDAEHRAELLTLLDAGRARLQHVQRVLADIGLQGQGRARLTALLDKASDGLSQQSAQLLRLANQAAVRAHPPATNEEELQEGGAMLRSHREAKEDAGGYEEEESLDPEARQLRRRRKVDGVIVWVKDAEVALERLQVAEKELEDARSKAREGLLRVTKELRFLEEAAEAAGLLEQGSSLAHPVARARGQVEAAEGVVNTTQDAAALAPAVAHVSVVVSELAVWVQTEKRRKAEEDRRREGQAVWEAARARLQQHKDALGRNSNGTVLASLVEESLGDAQEALRALDLAVRQGKEHESSSLAVDEALDRLQAAINTHAERLAAVEKGRGDLKARLGAVQARFHDFVDKARLTASTSDAVAASFLDRAVVRTALASTQEGLQVAEDVLKVPITVAWWEAQKDAAQQQQEQEAVHRAIAQVERTQALMEEARQTHEAWVQEWLAGEAGFAAARTKQGELEGLVGVGGPLAHVRAAQAALEACQTAQDVATKLLAQCKRAGSDDAAEDDAAVLLHMKRAVALYTEEVQQAEALLAACQVRKEAEAKQRAQLQERVEAVLARFQSTEGMIEAAGPTVKRLCHALAGDASAAINHATRLVRRGGGCRGEDAPAPVGEHPDAQGALLLEPLTTAVLEATRCVDRLETEAGVLRTRVDRATAFKIAEGKKLVSLRETLRVCSDKAEAHGLVAHLSAVGVALSGARDAVETVALKLEGQSIEGWMNQLPTLAQDVDAAVAQVASVEELVDQAAERQARMAQERATHQAAQQALRERHAVADRAANEGGIRHLVAVQQAIQTVEVELGALSEEENGGDDLPQRLEVLTKHVLHEEEVVATESRRFRARETLVQQAATDVSLLMDRMGRLDGLLQVTFRSEGLVEKKEPDGEDHARGKGTAPPLPVPPLHVQEAVRDAKRALSEVQRFVREGLAAPHLPPPSTDTALDLVRQAEEATHKHVALLGCQAQQREGALQRYRFLERKFSDLQEDVACFCAKSDHLRVQLDAEWDTYNWVGTQSGHTQPAGTTGAADANRKPLSSVQLLTERVGVAHAALVTAKKVLGDDGEAGESSFAALVEDAALKIDQASEVMERERVRAGKEEHKRLVAVSHLEQQQDRVVRLRVMAEARGLDKAGAVVEVLQAAEVSLGAVARLLDAGQVLVAGPAQEVAVQKLRKAEEVVVWEIQRKTRHDRQRLAAKEDLACLRLRRQALRQVVAGMAILSEAGPVADSLVDVEKALAQATLAVEEETLSLPLATLQSELRTVVRRLDAAEREVRRARIRHEEMEHCAQQQAEEARLRAAREADEDRIQGELEKLKRSQLEVELEKLTCRLALHRPALDNLQQNMIRAEEAVKSARDRLQHGGGGDDRGLGGRHARAPSGGDESSSSSGSSSTAEAEAAAEAASTLTASLEHAVSSLMLTTASSFSSSSVSSSQSPVRQHRGTRSLGSGMASTPLFDGQGAALQAYMDKTSHTLETVVQSVAALSNGVADLQSSVRQQRRAIDAQQKDPVTSHPEEEEQEAGHRVRDEIGRSSTDGAKDTVPAGEEKQRPVREEKKQSFMDEDVAELLRKNNYDESLFDKLKGLQTPGGVTLQDCIATGSFEADTLELFAGDAASYELFRPLFEPLIKADHPLYDQAAKQPQDRDPTHLREALGAEALADDRGGDRMRLGRAVLHRNLKGHNYTPKMTAKQLRRVETAVVAGLQRLSGPLQGTYTGWKELMQDEALQNEYAACGLPVARIMSESASVLSAWPEGRGVFLSGDRSLCVLVNAEDHVTIIATARPGEEEEDDLEAEAEAEGGNNSSTPIRPAAMACEAFEVACQAVAALEQHLTFEFDDHLGFITASPAKLGNAVQFSMALDPPPSDDVVPASRLEEVEERFQVTVMASEDSWIVFNRLLLGVSEVESIKAVVMAAQHLLSF